jgi:uncharacterized protein (TIGR02246 family)
MARLRQLALCGIVILCWASAAYGQASSPASMRSEIQQTVRAYVDAMNKGDFASYAEMYSRQPGVTSVGDGKITRGWDQIRQDIDGHLSMAGKFSVGLGSIDVTLLGLNYAMALTKYNITVGSAGGEQVQRAGAMTLLFQKVEGEWKIIHDHTSMEAGDAGVERASSPAPASTETARAVRTASTQPAPTIIGVANGRAAEIKPGGWIYYTFQLPAATCEIRGRITGISGGNKDFEAFITNDDGFQNWSAGQQSRVFWQSGRVVVTSIENAVIVGPGTFQLVVSNRWSGVTSKTVQSQAMATCSQ